jgi:hypothetical protein
MPFDFYLTLGAVTFVVGGFALLWRSIKKSSERPFRDSANYDETYRARESWGE